MLHERSPGTPLILMVTIFDRGQDGQIMDLFTREGVTFNLLTHGRGTANSQILGFLGLGEAEKTLLFSTMSSDTSDVLLRGVGEVVGPDKPNRGIAFTLPVHSVCGIQAVKDLLGVSEIERGEEPMEERGEHDLIVVIANRGFADVIMETAKGAGATGGTVVHARGTGAKEIEKFFGAAILPEKDLILIVTKGEARCSIMEAIAAEAGPRTDARAIVFSVPVNGVAGLSTSPGREPEPS